MLWTAKATSLHGEACTAGATGGEERQRLTLSGPGNSWQGRPHQAGTKAGHRSLCNSQNRGGRGWSQVTGPHRAALGHLVLYCRPGSFECFFVCFLLSEMKFCFRSKHVEVQV